MKAAGLVVLALAAATGPACAFGVAIDQSGFALEASILDLRVSTKRAKAGSASVESDKRAMSENAREFGETIATELAPLIAEGAAKGATEALLAESGIGLACKVPGLLGVGDDPPEPEEPGAREGRPIE